MQDTIKKDFVFWLLAIFAIIYVLGNIGSGSLTTWDEAVYANISREILKTGDWFVLHQGGTPWFDKPPFYMWCTALFYSLFGISEFSTRLTSSIFGVATVLLVYVFTKKISSRNAALVSALFLLAAPHYLHYSKMGMLDVTLTFFISLMLFFFWMGQERPAYLFWSGLIFSIAYLVKGLAAITGPGIIVLYCLASYNGRLLVKREFLIGIACSIFTVFFWHLAQIFLNGSGALNNYFGFHIFKRATTVLEGHSGGLNFYQKVIFNKNKPWSVIFYGSAIYMAWLAFKNKDKRGILMLSWIAVVYVICTMVRTKLQWYIMPIYPALAISSGIFIEKFITKKMFSFFLALVLIGMLLQVPFSRAFKLDLNPDIKNASAYAKDLHKKGADIYYKIYDDKETFYLDSFASVLPEPLTELSENSFYILRNEDLRKISIESNKNLIAVRSFGQVAIVKIKGAKD